MNRKGIAVLAGIMTSLLFFTNCGKKIQGPAIRFNKTTFDFGEAAEGKEVEHSFTFKNPGTEILVIKNVRATCGCTVTGEYDKEIKPGKSGKIPVVFRTRGYKNEVSKTISVETNVPDLDMINLVIKGTVKIFLEVEPKNIWLGRFSSKEELDGSFKVINHTDKIMKIVQIDPSNDNTRVEVNTVEDGKIYEIDFFVRPPFQMGNIKEEIIVTTNIKEQPVSSVYYNYYKMDLLEINPKEIIIYSQYMKSSMSRIISVYNNTETEMRIGNVIVKGEGITHSIDEIIKGKEARIVLTFVKDFKYIKGKEYSVSFKLNNVLNNPTYTVPIIEGSIKR